MCHVSGIQWKKSVLRVKIEESMIRGGIERDVLLSRKLKYTSTSYSKCLFERSWSKYIGKLFGHIF